MTACSAGTLPVPPGWASWEAVMDEAMGEARVAARAGEVPVGALLFDERGEILARAHNAPITHHDPTAHAELLALRQGAATTGNYRLPGTVLVVTLEPCLMCVGAMVHARVAGLVYGAPDPKTGAVASRLSGLALPFHNHQVVTMGGVRASECGSLLTEFFRSRRQAVARR